jgi:4-hydroxy-3-methylbut-2-en-1-yl diphosphate reductase
MKVVLANPRGFCAGVNMAIESLNKALEIFGAPVYVYHEIVHNRTVVERFTKRGVVFVNAVEEVPHGAPLLFSAHGIAPEIRRLSKERNLRSVDATCPLVTKVHLEALRFAKLGYRILLIGHSGHDEVIGTMGEAPEAIELVETVEDVEALNFAPGTKLAFLTQTTLSVDDAGIIIRALRKRYPDITGPAKDDICYATQNRQEAVRTLAAEADIVLVLGSQNSSNSLRLAEIAKNLGKPSYLIDHVGEVDPAWFVGKETVLITAGASAPEDVVQECVEYFERTFGATVKSETVREEHVTFPPPKELRGGGYIHV